MIGDIIKGILHPNVIVETYRSDYEGKGSISEIRVKIVGFGRPVGLVLCNKAIRGFVVGDCQGLFLKKWDVTIRGFELSAWGPHQPSQQGDAGIPF